MKVNNNNPPSEVWHIRAGERRKSITNQRTHTLSVRFYLCSVSGVHKAQSRHSQSIASNFFELPISQKSFDEKGSATNRMQIYANQLHSIFDALTSGIFRLESCKFSAQNAYTYEYSLLMRLGAENRKNKYYFLVRPVVVGFLGINNESRMP